MFSNNVPVTQSIETGLKRDEPYRVETILVVNKVEEQTLNGRKQNVMNPATNRFEPLTEPVTEEVVVTYNLTQEQRRRQRQRVKKLDPVLLNVLLRPNGKPVPDWSIFRVGEDVVVKDYVFRIAYIGETNIVLEPVGSSTRDKEDT